MSISNCNHCNITYDTDYQYESDPYDDDEMVCNNCFNACYDVDKLIPKIENGNWVNLNVMTKEAES